MQGTYSGLINKMKLTKTSVDMIILVFKSARTHVQLHIYKYQYIYIYAHTRLGEQERDY